MPEFIEDISSVPPCRDETLAWSLPSAPPGKTLTLSFPPDLASTSSANFSIPIVMGMEKFAELVEAKSGGKLKVNVFPGGALGSDQANVSSLQGGTLEMSSMNSGIFASLVKDFAIYDFPFLFANGKEADAVVDGPFGKALHAKLEEKGLVGLA